MQFLDDDEDDSSQDEEDRDEYRPESEAGISNATRCQMNTSLIENFDYFIRTF
jgi:hypothetical protein